MKTSFDLMNGMEYHLPKSSSFGESIIKSWMWSILNQRRYRETHA